LEVSDAGDDIGRESRADPPMPRAPRAGRVSRSGRVFWEAPAGVSYYRISVKAGRRPAAALFGLIAVLAGSSAWSAPPSPRQAGPGVGSRPVTAEARVVRREPWPPPGAGAARYLVEVEEILAGFVPAPVMVVSVEESSAAAPHFGAGARLHLVLLELPNGEYRVRSARRLPADRDVPHDPQPRPLAFIPAQPLPWDLEARAMNGTPSFEQQVAEIVNQERWSNGQLPPLKQVEELDNSSGLHSANMAQRDFFAHCDPDTGTSADDRMLAAGYSLSSWGENIAAGYSTPAAVMTAWMGSSGHRANILSSGYREIGVGYELQSGDLATVRLDDNGDCTPDNLNNGPYFNYWTQNFGRRTNVYPVVIDREAYETTTTSVDLYVYGEGWAVDMRFSNDGSSWSSWEPYVADKAWTLSSGNGTKTVYAEIRNGGTVYQQSDTIVLSATCTADYIDLHDQTVTTTEIHDACIRITAGPNYVVDDHGDVTCHAPTVVLKNGFRVLSGARFAAGA
jgi:uncharacterized protein YkwD